MADFTDGCTLLAIAMLTCQWQLVVQTIRKKDLIQTALSVFESCRRGVQVEPPHSQKVLSEHFAHLVCVLFKISSPVIQRTSIMKAKIFHIQNAKASFSHSVCDFRQMREIASGKIYLFIQISLEDSTSLPMVCSKPNPPSFSSFEAFSMNTGIYCFPTCSNIPMDTTLSKVPVRLR